MKNKKIALIITLVSVLMIALAIGLFAVLAQNDPEAELAASERGDVNGDGMVDTRDVVYLSQYFASYDYDTDTAAKTLWSGADVNRDGKITLADLQALRKGIANGEFHLDYPIPETNNGDGEVIANANNLWAGVNAYYQDSTRKDFTIENNDMSFNIHTEIGDSIVSSITNSNGASYIEDTMDVFVKMNDGKTYYSSGSMNATNYDLYRFGMYYYELRAQNQKLAFVDGISYTSEQAWNVVGVNPENVNEMTTPVLNATGDAMSSTLTGLGDPKIQYNNSSFSASSYNYLAIDVKVISRDNSSMRSLNLYTWKSVSLGLSRELVNDITQNIANDGEFHTYYFKLDDADNYSGTINTFRLDFGGQIGDTFEYKNVRVLNGTPNGPVDLRLCRYLHVYSDKAQQVIQVSAVNDTPGIQEIGIVTNVDVSKVNKVIVKNATGTFYDVNGVDDWDTVEYVGFDIEGAGIFGYILLPDGDIALSGRTELTDTSSGKIKVTVEGDKYVIVQSRAPEGNQILAPSTTSGETNYDNQNDFFMGHRIYTDTTHSFDDFIKEAAIERNPLTSSNIVVDTNASTGASYLGYDALRGMYVFDIDGSNFSTPYYEEQNKHYNVKFTVTGDAYDRNMYIMTTTTHGELQSAAILDQNNMLLPINVQVGKNFSDSGTSVFDVKDDPWSEACFPMSIKAEEEKTYNFLNLYMNWGNFPLKQVSSIQLAPLYHLSTGVTETNCILPWYSNMGYTRTLLTTPDHRPMSAPFLANQPNHTSGGDHRFLQYTDAEGNYVASEVKANYVTSYGPTYAEIVFEHLSDDGKIKATYTHMEMPQTDENRAYYTMEYKILKDITFDNFMEKFSFYSVDAYTDVVYEKVGYLNTDNECTVENATADTTYYYLGTNAPYFSLFLDSDYTRSSGADRGYVNLSFLIKDAEFNLAKVDGTPNFVVKSEKRALYLTLDLAGVTLKAGDTIKINSIIMPFGWGGNDASLPNMGEGVTVSHTTTDQQVRDVRENTILNPLKAVAGEGMTDVATNWLPEVKIDKNATEGTFTLKGASNNSTVKISGVNKLCVPMVYEKIGENWVRYNLSSEHSPDSKRYGQSYDGYGVQYNTDGTYTYSFVVDMSAGEDREFKVVFSDDFIEETRGEVDPALTLTPEQIADNADNMVGTANNALGSVTLSGDGKYVTITNDQTMSNGFFYLVDGGTAVTGQYMMIKYKSENADRWQWGVRTDGQTDYDWFWLDPINDGEWHTAIVDLSNAPYGRFIEDGYGRYRAKTVRWGIMYTKQAYEVSIDVASVAFSDHIEDLVSYSGDNNYIFYDRIESFVAKVNPDNHTHIWGEATCTTAETCIFCNTTNGVAPGHTWGEEVDGVKTCTVCDAKQCQPGAHVVVETTSNSGTTMTVTGTCSNCKEEQYSYNHTFGETRPLYFLTASQIATNANKIANLGGATMSADGTYTTISNKQETNNAFFYLVEGGKTVTGQYMMIKYRSTNADKWEWYTKSKDFSGSMQHFYVNPLNTGEWQTIIVDLSQVPGGAYATSSDGKYYAGNVRWAIMRYSQSYDISVDVQFVAFSDDVANLTAIGGTAGYVNYVGFDNARLAQVDANNHAHIWTEATCETPATCMLCSATEGEALGHAYNSTVTTEPTCTTAGVRTYVCSNDASHTYTESIDALGHNYVVDNDGIHICSRCDKKRAVRVTISNIGGKAQFVSSQKYIFSVGKTTSTTSGKQGMLYLKGWGALCGEATGIKYRVLTSDGSQVIQEWRDLEAWDSSTLWENNTTNLETQQGIDPTITNAYNFIGKIDLSAFPGATLTVEVAFVLKDAPEGEDLLIFAHATNITNRETRSAYFNVTTLNDISVGGFSSASVFDENHAKYPTDGYVATRSDMPGNLYIFGWGGTQGAAKDVAYRVVDANGDPLTGWLSFTKYNNIPTLSLVTNTSDAVYTNVTGAIPGASAYYFRGCADLSAYEGQKVDVEVAFILDNALEDGEIFTFFTVKNVLYQRPVQFNVQSVGSEGMAQLVNGTSTSFDDALTTPSTGDYAGKIFFQGYGGTIGEVAGVQFRVCNNSTGEIIQDWKNFEQYIGSSGTKYPILADVSSLTSSGSTYLENLQAKIPSATVAYMVRGYMDISAFYGQTVTIEIAFVLEDQTHFIFATETNCTNTAERPVGLNINSLQGYLKPSWHTEVLVFGENYVYSGSTSNVTKPSYPTGGIATSTSKVGTLYISGWAGTNAEATDFVFRVLDANGNVISTASEGYADGWTNNIVKESASGGGSYNTFEYNSSYTTNIQTTVAGGFAYIFRGYLDLTEFAGQGVTVECAFVLKDVPESQKYFTFITIEKVNVGG